MHREVRIRTIQRIIGTRKSIFIAFYVIVVCSLCLWALPDPNRGNDIDAADIDRFSRVGLAAEKNVHRLAEALCEFGSGNFLENLEAKLNQALVVGLKSELPAPSIEFFGDDDDFARGRFSSDSWLIRLNSKLISTDNVIDLLSVVAHEIRHAEQTHLTIVYHAKIGDRKDKIKFVANVPDHIVKNAMNKSEHLNNDELQFGELLSSYRLSREMYRKNVIFIDLLERNKGRKEYADLRKRFVDEIPIERDAVSFQRIMRPAIESCLS